MREQAGSGNRLGWLALGAGAALGITAFYVFRAQFSQRRRSQADRDMPDPYLTESITINKPVEQVYEAWRNLESVGFLRGARITETRDQEMCAWHSADGAYGHVRFRRAPGARGTEVHVEIEQPQRHIAESIVRAFGMAADQQIREDLRRFKQLLETGELTLSDGPSLWRPAQPALSREQVIAFTAGGQS